MVDRWAEKLRSTSAALNGFANDLQTPSDETEFLDLLVPYRLRAYHATRLLDHEMEAIRGQGIRLLTPEFVVERIENAFKHAAVTAEQQTRLLNNHHFAKPLGGKRDGFVWASLGSISSVRGPMTSMACSASGVEINMALGFTPDAE